MATPPQDDERVPSAVWDTPGAIPGNVLLPDEIVEISPECGYANVLYSAMTLAALASLAVSSVAAALWLTSHLAGDLGALRFVQLGGGFLAASFVVFALLAIPISRASVQEWRPVRITATGEDLFVETRETSVVLPLCSCAWQVTSGLFCDSVGFHWPQRPLLLISMRPSCANAYQRRMSFACGFTDQAFLEWSEYLTGTCAWKQRTSTAREVTQRILGSATVIGGLGIAVEVLSRRLGVAWISPGGLAVTGVIDGGIAGLYWQVFQNRHPDDVVALIDQRPNTLTLSAALGVMAFGIAGADVIVSSTVAIGNFLAAIAFLEWIAKKAKRRRSHLADA